MEGFVVKFAKYSFGIYLCHMLFFEPFKQMKAWGVHAFIKEAPEQRTGSER